MKDKKILVSIVIPYFRKKSFILKTLNSIKKQTYKYYEIIIVYDDDNLEEFKFLQKQAFKEKKIKIYRNRSNFGVSYSRNLGVKKAKGDFIAFIDADDLWHRKKLQRQLNFMINKKLLISHTNYKLIDENGNIIGLMKISKNTSYNNLLKSCDIGLSTVMVSKKIKKYIKFPKIKTKEDFVLWLRLSKKFKINGLQQTLGYWRKSKKSLSSSLLQKFNDAFLVYSKYERFSFFKSILLVLILSFNFLKKSLLQKVMVKF